MVKQETLSVILGLIVGVVGCTRENKSQHIVKDDIGRSVGELNLVYEHKADNESVGLGYGVWTANGFVCESEGFDAFVFFDGWYLIHHPDEVPSVGLGSGWVLVQDTGDIPDGVAEFRAVYLVPPNMELDFSTSGNATFVLDIIAGELVKKEDVVINWTVGE